MIRYFVIDTKAIGDLTINNVLDLYKLYIDPTYPFTEFKGQELYVKQAENGEYWLRGMGLKIITSLMRENLCPTPVTKDEITEYALDSFVDKYRKLFKGTKPGNMGSAESVKKKITRWMQANPEYSFADILSAASKYITSLGTQTKYCQRADYFIYKKESSGVENSRLSAFIDEADLPEEDWTSTIS